MKTRPGSLPEGEEGELQEGVDTGAIEVDAETGATVALAATPGSHPTDAVTPSDSSFEEVSESEVPRLIEPLSAALDPAPASSAGAGASPSVAPKPAPTPMFEAFTQLLGKLQKEGGNLWTKKGQSTQDAWDLALFPTKALRQLTGAAFKDIFVSAGRDFKEAGNAFEAVRQSWSKEIIDAAQLKTLLGKNTLELQAATRVSEALSGKKYSPAELQAVLYDLLDTKTAKEAFTVAISADMDVQGKLTDLRAKDGNTQPNRKKLAESLVNVFEDKILTEKFGYKLSTEDKDALANVLAADSEGGKPNPLLSKLINPPSGEFVLKVGAKRVFVTLAIGFTAALAVTATMSVLGLPMLSGVGTVILMGAIIAACAVAYKTFRDKDKIKNLETLKRQNAVFSSLRKEIGEKFVKKGIKRTAKTHTMASKLRTAVEVIKAAAKGLRHGAAGTAKGAAGVGVGAVGLAATAATLAASLPVAGGAAAGVATAHGAKRAADATAIRAKKAADATSEVYHAGAAAVAGRIAKSLKKAAEGLAGSAKEHERKSGKKARVVAAGGTSTTIAGVSALAVKEHGAPAVAATSISSLGEASPASGVKADSSPKVVPSSEESRQRTK